jgi:predicted MPP superfamily phosphohydrolase
MTTPPKTAAALQGPQGEIGLVLPVKEKSLRFAIIGDTGSGGQAQYQVATEMARWRAKFPFELVLLLGDNIYGADGPRDYQKKFEAPYKALLDAGVKFYASLGNHDSPNQRFYKQFNMAGERYYTFKGSVASVRFFALDSNYIDKEQLAWLEKELQGSASEWKICYFHHPLYSSGRMHGPSVDKREVLEPLLEKYKVDVVFSGHEHFYERIKPQKGIHYFISGAAGKLRTKDILKTPITEKGYDEDFHFMLVEITGDEMYFQTISRVGTTVDSGVIRRVPQQG